MVSINASSSASRQGQPPPGIRSSSVPPILSMEPVLEPTTAPVAMLAETEDAAEEAPAVVERTFAKHLDAIMEAGLPFLFSVLLTLAFVAFASAFATSLGFVKSEKYSKQRAGLAPMYAKADLLQDFRTIVSTAAGTMLCYAVFGRDKSAELLDLRASRFPMLFP
eukprot:TRINITY_DN40770_c0_g1_i1.p1 TRINITY_DN40770_c0_g1~~TRINITY_DN40770_c0_g1_i1.p1  ORF type:complete len:165 (-),score=23.47 TRINITY_DN40770_c0_g1_i1:67-561(-)